MKKLVMTAASAILALGVLTGCEEGEPDAAKEAREARQKGVEQIREKQPVHAMKWSPTIKTMNRWAETWGQEGKVSYVYMQRQDGTFAGYYVLDGLPVSYCTMGSPPYDFVGTPDDGRNAKDQMVPATGLDGAYYSGCDENRYYGFDAVSGQYVEYTDGMVLTAVLSDQPLPLDKQPIPFGSSIEDVKNR